MAKISFPFGSGHLTTDIDDGRIAAVLQGNALLGADAEESIVSTALRNPIASPPLAELAKSKRRITIITSDHTRSLPSQITLPLLLQEIRRSNPAAEITILVGCGTHRSPTEAELIARFGEELLRREKIVVHHGDDSNALVEVGILPSGYPLEINKIAAEADLLIAEGSVNQHTFAGFSGGPKSILPGVSSHKTIRRNHCGPNLAHPRARPGILFGNPSHDEMRAAAELARLAFILNVVIGENGRIAAAFAGDWRAAHARAVEFVSKKIRVPAVHSPLTITSSGGYPLDQNLYQAIKGMVTGEATTIPGGHIIVVAECRDGLGTDAFDKFISKASSAAEFCRWAENLSPDETPNGLWMAQVFGRIVSRFKVVVVSEALSSSGVRIPGLTVKWPLQDALAESLAELGPEAKITVIPNGAQVMPIGEE